MGRSLIVGGMGLFGRYLARKLSGEGEAVAVMDVTDQFPAGFASLAEKVKAYRGDASNWVHVLETVVDFKPDCIYHVAAIMGVPCEQSPALAYQINMNGTFNVLEAARIQGVKQVLFVSSRATYAQDSPLEINDDVHQRPTNMYGVTKVSGELMGEQYQRKYGMDFRALRFPVVIGVGRLMNLRFGELCNIIEKSVVGEPVLVQMKPEASLTVIYVKDCIEALVQLKKAEQKSLKKRVYNITGAVFTPAELAEAVKPLVKEVKVKFEPDTSEAGIKLARAMAKTMDESAAVRDWGWQSRYATVSELAKDYVAEIKTIRGLTG